MKILSSEQWAEARALYEGGMTLARVAERFGVSFSAVQYHGWIEKWPVRRKGAPADGRNQAARARQMRRKLEKEERRLAEELVLVKAADVEVLARRNLAADSGRTKLAVSRRVGEILAGLDDPGISLRAKAQTLNALAPIIKLLHRWHEEPSIEQMERAKGAINLELIGMSPEQLKELGPRELGDDPFASKPNRPGLAASVDRPEQPKTSPPVSQPKKEAPTPPLDSQPAQPARTGHPPPLATRQDSFEAARAEHRLACRQKYG